MESLAQLEALCERLYNSQDSSERAQTETTLSVFSTSPDYISQCLYILDNGSTSYVLMMASSSLLKQVTYQNLPVQLRLDIRNYLISYLATKGEQLEPFVIGSLIKLLCRVTKFGWFDDEKFRGLVDETTKFLAQFFLFKDDVIIAILEICALSIESLLQRKIRRGLHSKFGQAPCHYAIGLKILNQLVSEMNQAHPVLSLPRQRRIAATFKDKSLLKIFQISINSLHQFKIDVGSKLQGLALSLSLSCLSFDFLGSSFDESSDEISAVQVPVRWRKIIEDPSTVQIFFDYYAINQSQAPKEALECLVYLTSIKQSLFTNKSSREKFLSHLMMGTKEILQTERGLSDHDNYHLFCRLLSRFKTNFQFIELISVDGYSDWIRLIAEFTIKSLNSWQWASSSVYYVLGLWSRLVTSLPYLKEDKPNMLAEYVPTIIERFVSKRFDSLQSECSDELSENPLDNVNLLQDQLGFFPYLFRFQHESCHSYIVKVMEPLFQTYMKWANLQAYPDNTELSLTESKLAWIVHIVAAIIATKDVRGLSGELQELLDAELSALIFQLIKVTDKGAHQQRYGDSSKQRLDRAILTFLQHFTKSYIGDQAMHSSKLLYERLSALVGLNGHLQVLNAVVEKIAINLKSYSKCKEVIDHNLSLFLEMTSGYMIAKKLLELDAIKFMISNHKKEHFPFLEDHTCFRSRTTFYRSIGTLIFMEESVLTFRCSMDPLMQVFFVLGSTPDAMFRSAMVKYALIGVTRDLRGITMAVISSKSYGLLFDWLFPSQFNLLLKGISHWFDAPEVTTPVLKFMAEFVLNKSRRVKFDSSSPNGILLFREVSKLLVTYGSGILSLANTADMYTSKYKGIGICLKILTRVLSGNYVNFGVFELYGDRALADAFDSALKMMFSIPLAEMLAYLKLAVAYFSFLGVLFDDHLAFVTILDTRTFMHIVGSLDSGLKASNERISSLAALAIDKLATSYFTNITMGESPTSPAVLNLAQKITDCPGLFPQILKTLFELVTFDDRNDLWSLTRPMLSLTLINEEMFTNIKNQILASQPSDQQERLSVFFNKIMSDVNRSLETTNRDKFSQNVNKIKSGLWNLSLP